MVGEDAVIKIGADIGGAVAGLKMVEMQFKHLDTAILASAAKVRSVTKMMVTAFAAVGVAAGVMATVGLAKSIRTFEDYEQQVANAASVTGTMGQAFEDTKANIDDISKTLGATTVFSAQAAAEAMYDLASAGYDVSNMVSGDLKPILDLAAATQEDLTRTTEITTAILGQFQLGISDSQYVTDIFAKTIGSSKATLEKMGLSFKYVGPIARMFGNSVEGVSAALGVMYNNGLKGEQAGRSMRMAFTRLAKPTADVKRVIAELGLTLEDINPDAHTFNDILRTLEGAGIGSAQGLRLFGAEAATGMMSIINNLDVLKELETSLGDAGGAAEDMAEKQLDTLKGSSILLTSAIENLKIEIGEKFAPTVKKMNFWLRDVALIISDKVGPSFDKLTKMIKGFIPTWTALKSIWTSIKGVFKDVINILPIGGITFEKLTNSINKAMIAVADFMAWIDEHPKITQFVLTLGLAVVAFSHMLPVILGAKSALMAFGTVIAALSSPIILLLAPIALLAAAWTTNLYDIRDKTKSVTDDLKTSIGDNLIPAITNLVARFKEIGRAIADVVGPMIEKLMEWLKGIVPIIVAEIIPTIITLVEWLKEIGSTIANRVGPTILTLIGWLKGIGQAIADKAVPMFTQLVAWLKEIIPVIIDGIGPAFDAFEAKIKEFEPTWESLKSIWGSLKGIFDDVIDVLVEMGGTSENLTSVFETFTSILSIAFEKLPGVINTVSESIADFLAWVDEHPEVTKLVITLGLAAVAFSAIVTVGGILIGIVTTIGATIGALVAGLSAVVSSGAIVATVIAALGGPITIIIAAIALLAAAWATNLFGIRDKTHAVVDKVKELFTKFKDFIEENKEKIVIALKLMLGPIGLIVLAFENWDKIKEIVSDIKDNITEKLTSLGTDAKEWGKNIITSFIDGIKSKFSGLRNIISSAAVIVEDYLGFHSPTREGPGQDVMEWGPNLVDSFAEGMSNNMNVLNDAFTSLVAPATDSSVVGGSMGGTNIFNITIRDPVVREDSDIDQMVSKIETVLARKSRSVGL